MIIDAKGMHFAELDRLVKSSKDSDITINNVLGQRYIAAGASGKSIVINGTPGNALGAFCGGLPIAAGLPPRYAALVGVPFLLCGLIACVIFSRKYEPKA